MSQRFEGTPHVTLFSVACERAEESLAAGREWQDRLGGRLRGYVTRLLPDQKQEVDDLMQTAVRNAVEHRSHAPAEDDGFRKWLLNIARSGCIDFLRRPRRGERLPEEEPAASTPGPETQLRRKETSEQMQQALSRLAPELSEVVRLHHLEGNSVAEVGRQLQRETSKLRRQLKDAYGQMRGWIGENPAA